MDQAKYYRQLTEAAKDTSDTKIGLINRNLKFALSMAHKYKHLNSKLEFEDFISAANEGMIRAAEKFDPSKGNKFITYARAWIFKYIHERCVYDTTNRLIGVPITHQNRCKNYNRMKEEGKSDKEICKKLNITERQLKTVKKYNVVSNETSLDIENDDGYSIENFIYDNSLVDVYDNSAYEGLVKKEESNLANNSLKKAIKSLKNEDKKIIEEHFFQNKNISQIAKKHKTTNAKIKKSLTEILEKLKTNIGNIDYANI